jgi:hypothetical protein
MARKRRKTKKQSSRPSRGPWVVIAVIIAGTLALYLATRERGETGVDEPDEPPPPATGKGNLLSNPGFESGEEGWEWLSWSKGWAPFEISEGRRRSGERALHLPVRSEGEVRRTIVWGVVQDVTIDAFPECLEGWYLVSDWERGAEKQYLQTVIISDLKTPSGADKQIRMMLTGMDRPSYNLSNARYFFCDPGKPVTPPLEKWVHFKCSPRTWFLQAWGELPEAGHRLRVFFEARFDDRKSTEKEVVAETFFDDLYLGPATDGHCQ